MKLYRFSPIQNRENLERTIRHIHFQSQALCKNSLHEYLSVAGNVGVFTHYDDEYQFLIKLREKLTDDSDNFRRKYYRLHQPITIPAKGDVPEVSYDYLYIRQPDPYRAQVGDVDFVMDKPRHQKLKQSLLNGQKMPGMRAYPRPDLDLIELYNPDVDVLAYVATTTMAEEVGRRHG